MGIAVGVTIGGIAVIAGVVAFVLCKRKQSRRARGIEDGQDTLPRVFGTLSGNDSATEPFVAQSNSSTLANKRMMSQLVIGTGSTSSGPVSTAATSPPPGLTSYSGSRPGSSSSVDRPLPALPQRSPRPDSRDSASTSPHHPRSPFAPRHHTKAAEAQARLPGTAEDNQPQADQSSAPSNPRPFSGNTDIIIQHRDGGVVQELPPPYLDRSLSATTTDTQ